jgi:ribose 5-phosphate isomerase A
MSDSLKRAAAERAVAVVSDGMRLGLGTGSTAAHFVSLLGERVRGGLKVVGVPTSEATRQQAEREGIPLTTLDETPELDLTVDGADELDDQLRLIKGGGAALLREKIVAAASRRMIVIADGSKRVARLGKFPLPIEVVPFGLEATRRAIVKAMGQVGAGGDVRLRTAANGTPLLTDGGHYILDAHLRAIEQPEALGTSLNNVPGVVEHGLFLGLATGAVLATERGLVELGEVRP